MPQKNLLTNLLKAERKKRRRYANGNDGSGATIKTLYDSWRLSPRRCKLYRYWKYSGYV